MAKRVLVLTLCLMVMASLAVFGAKQPTTGKVIKPATLDQEGRNAVSRYILTPTPKVSMPFAGDTVGFTYEDYWHNDGSRRSIARDDLGGLHFEWGAADNALDVFSIYYNYYSGGNWVAAGTGIMVPNTEGSGGGGGKRPSLDLLPDGREVLGYRIYSSPRATAMSVEKATAGLGEFNQYDLPDSLPGSSYYSTWPYLAVSKVESGDTAFIFITGSQNSSTAGPASYTRCYLRTDTLWCQPPGGSLRQILPNTLLPQRPRDLTYVFDPKRDNVGSQPIATSPVSQKVAVAWNKQVGSNTKDEVVYLESTNNGSDWNTAGNMGTLHQITNYGPDYAIQILQSDNDCIYDYNDDLHIAWVTGTSASGNDNTLWHWNKSTGIASKITHNAQTKGTSPAFNRSINKVTLGITDEDSSYLYVTYIKYSDNDLGADDYPNGELYLQASSNGGLSWGPPVNLSNTPTPGCTPPNCRNEAYPSMAKYADDSIFVIYLFDLDAGAADYSTAEGIATNNPVRYIGMPRPTVPAVPGLYYAPSQLTSPVEWATNHNSKTDSIKVDNTGTSTLEVQLSGPSWLGIAPTSFSIAELGPTQKVTLTLNGGPYADTFLTGQMKILSNNGVVGGGANFNDTQYVNINFVVTDTFYLAEYDTCKRGPKLVVSNVGNLGAQSDSAGMFWNGNNFLFEGTPVMATNQVPGFGSDTVGFSWMHDYKDFIPEGHLIKTDYASLKATVWIDKFALLNWRRANADPTHWSWFGWTKWSKIIQFDWTPGNVHGVLIKNWWTWNKPPKWWMDVTTTTPAGGYFGIGGDWDVTADFSGKDQGGIIDSLNLVYLRQDTVNTDKYYGGYQFLSAYVKKGATTNNYTTPFAMHVGNNRSELFKNTPSGYGDDSLYKTMSTPGDYIELPDSGLDRHIVISAVEMLNPDTTTEIGIDYTAIVSDVNLVDFVRQAAIFKKVKPGDANVDGKVTVSDVVFLVNYLFKGGPEPWLMYSDANGDSKVTVSDVVYLVNYLFKGGPPAQFVVGQKPF